MRPNIQMFPQMLPSVALCSFDLGWSPGWQNRAPWVLPVCAPKRGFWATVVCQVLLCGCIAHAHGLTTPLLSAVCKLCENHTLKKIFQSSLWRMLLFLSFTTVQGLSPLHRWHPGCDINGRQFDRQGENTEDVKKPLLNISHESLEMPLFHRRAQSF